MRDPNNPCLFCNVKESGSDHENELAYASYDSFPVSEHHCLVIPKRHIKDYYEGNTFKFVKSKIKKVIKKDIFINDLKSYDEILLVGSGKGVASVKTIKEIGWKRKNLKQFKILSKYYNSIINKCTPYRFY